MKTLVPTLLELLAIPSVTGDEQQLAKDIEHRLIESLGPGRIRTTGSAVAAGDWNADGRPTVALFGHLDTVPGVGSNPPRVEGDRIFGLGASDMKAGLAVMLALAKTINAKDAPVRLLLAFYDAEEGDFAASGLPGLLAAAPQLLEADLAICLEPTDGQLHLGCVGSTHARLVFSGKAAHSARPWHGKNAIYQALPVLQELADWPTRPVEVDGLTYLETCVITLAHAGGGRNVVPDRFEINVNMRFAPGRTADDALAELRDRVAGRAAIEIVDRAPSALPFCEHPLVKNLVRATDAEVLPKQAWTDVARLAQSGVAAVNFGPGRIDQAHQQGEYCDLQTLMTVYGQLEKFLGEC